MLGKRFRIWIEKKEKNPCGVLTLDHCKSVKVLTDSAAIFSNLNQLDVHLCYFSAGRTVFSRLPH